MLDQPVSVAGGGWTVVRLRAYFAGPSLVTAAFVNSVTTLSPYVGCRLISPSFRS
jgi:hypothetical protein